MIKEGHIFKNWKEVCSHFGWKETGGDYKKAKLKEFDTMYRWHRSGNKIVIDEIYEKQLIKEDGRRDKAIYVDPIKTILFYSLKDFKGELYFSLSNFTQILEMFNASFYELSFSDNYEVYAEGIGVDVSILKGFKIGSKREAQRIVDRALNSMKSQRIIDYVKGRIIVTNKQEYRLASVEERKLIQEIEKEELTKLSCYNMASLKFKGLESKFYSNVKKRFSEEGLDYIDYTFNGYSIVSHDKTISEEIEKIEKEVNVDTLKLLFKERLITFAESNNKREIQKEYNKLGFGEPILEVNPIASSYYIPDFKKAIETFI